MQINRLIVSLVLSSPLCLGITIAHAQTTGETKTTTTTTVITSKVPAPKEIVVTPAGYVSCTTSVAGWQGKVWHPDYKVCRYETKSASIQGEAWIAGHWQCAEYTVTDGQSECTNWDWSAGHWVATLAEIQ